VLQRQRKLCAWGVAKKPNTSVVFCRSGTKNSSPSTTWLRPSFLIHRECLPTRPVRVEANRAKQLSPSRMPMSPVVWTAQRIASAASRIHRPSCFLRTASRSATCATPLQCRPNIDKHALMKVPQCFSKNKNKRGQNGTRQSGPEAPWT